MAENGQGGSQGAAGQDPFEMFRRLWAPLGLPVPGMAMPTLDPAEVEKRITDLKSVETWLGMNLNMVKMAIQGLEVQKMALHAMQANAGAASDAANAFANFSRAASTGASSAAAAEPAAKPDSATAAGFAAQSMPNPMLWPWAMMPGAAATHGSAAKADDKAGPESPNAAGKVRKEGK